MNELQALTLQRDELLAKIREIEASCEGIENENNALRVQQLNLEQAQLTAQKQELSAKLSALNSKLSAISAEIATLSSTGIDRILDAIKNQRWFFFKNKTKFLMDRDTGLLWANLDYFPYRKNNYTQGYVTTELSEAIRDYDFEIEGFRLPNNFELWDMICDKSFPYQSGNNWKIKDYWGWFVSYNGSIYRKDLDDKGATNDVAAIGNGYCLLPCSDILVQNTDYKQNVSPNNPNYTEKERLQFTLDLFTQNDLWPIFNNDEITQLYKKIYYEKPRLMEQLQALQEQIQELQNVVLLSSEFDYTSMLAKYDIKAIDGSVIKYYQAVQHWTDEIMEKLDYYEKKKESVINEFKVLSMKLPRKFDLNPALTNDENMFINARLEYFRRNFSIDMKSVKTKILNVKKQADSLESQIDTIDNCEDSIYQLALLEKKERAGFSFIAENTAKIIRNALKKIEFFEANYDYVVWAVETLNQWTEKYNLFKTTCYEEMKNSCETDGISEEIWKDWYREWQSIRFCIEAKLQPVIDRDFRNHITMINEDEISVAQQIIAELVVYRNAVDNFYREERKGIYQNLISQENGFFRDKTESESRLYKLTADFQNALQSIIFNCAKAEDRIFILNCLNDISDIHINEMIEFIFCNNSNKNTGNMTSKFAELKNKNYEIYLSDNKSYNEEQAKREKKFNELLDEIRNGLN